MIGPRNPAPARTWDQREVLFVTPFAPEATGEREARRAYFLCKRLKDRGARVHLLHCPLGLRRLTPERLEAHRRMAAEWDGFYFVPPKIPNAPEAALDACDRFWAAEIGSMVEWLFENRAFDVVLINSPWLAKTFAHCPPGVTKILDARDGFADPTDFMQLAGDEIDDPDKRRLFERPEIIWAKPWRVEEWQALTQATVMSVGHAEAFASSTAIASGATPRFGLVVGPTEIEATAAERFLRTVAERIEADLSPLEIFVAGRGANRLKLDRHAFVVSQQAGGAQDFYQQFDVAILLSGARLGTEASVLECIRRGKAVVSLGECWDEWRPTHRYHQLASFQEILAACETILTSPVLVDTLQDASFEAMAGTLRAAERTFDEAAPLVAPRAVGHSLSGRVVFVIAAREIWNGSLVLDHVCEAAQFVGMQAKTSFYLSGETPEFEAGALARLQALGALVFSPETARALAPQAVERLNADVVGLQKLAEAAQRGFWFASTVDVLPVSSDRFAATAFAPLSILAMASTEADVLEFASRLSARFTQLVAMDSSLTPLLSAAWSRGWQARLVPVLWKGDLSRLRPAAEVATGEGVTLFSADPMSAMTRLAASTALAATRRPVELVFDDRETAAPVFDDERLAVVSLSAYLRRLSLGEQRPWLAVDIGGASVFAALLDVLQLAGTLRLKLFVPGAPRPVVASRRSDIFNGVLESVFALRAMLLDESQAQVRAAPVRRVDVTVDDGGWTLIWDDVKRLVEWAAAPGVDEAATPKPLRQLRAEMIVNVQGQGAFRFSSPGWTDVRAPIEAFAVRPLQLAAPRGVEYMALGPEGRRTPWVDDCKLCGSRGEGVALTGFAVRPAPEMLDKIEVVYEGVFRVGGSVGPVRNGEICASSHDGDALLAMSVVLYECAG